MKLVTPPLTVKDSDGFANDKLQRQQFGEALSNFVSSSTDTLVISLDGKWGEGKTTFVKMWQGLLKKNGIPSIYIDAFKNDYTEDAFISIASAITSYVDQHSTESEKSTEFKDKAKNVGVRLLTWTAKIGIKAATLGVINESDIEALSEIGHEVATDTSETIAELVKERLTAHSKETEVFQSFRESLSELPASLKNNSSGRLVIVIDELDRCKPTFAVEILEKIKHLFSVKNVVFLLVMNKQQLEEAIKSVYGTKIDAHTYLQKFINVETSIPKRVADRHNNDINIYVQNLLELHEIEKLGNSTYIAKSLIPLAMHFSLSLRQLEKVFTNLAIFYSMSGKDYFRPVPIIVFISVVKVVNPNVFESLLRANISFNALSKELGFTEFNNMDTNNNQFNKLLEWVKYLLLSESEYQKINQEQRETDIEDELAWHFINREKLLPIFCEKLSMFKVN